VQRDSGKNSKPRAWCAQGGAIATVGGGALVIAGGIFRRNVAAEGSALSSTSPRSLKISNTTFDDSAGAFAGKAAEVQVGLSSVLLPFCNASNCMTMT
jgi:hypothetical protein